MAFAKVPEISKERLNKAGQSLLKNPSNPEALKLVNEWRACHAYPINTFQATLRKNVKKYGNDPIVAQRLKRMPTIVDKLKRYPSMNLTRMQDIGGVRAVLSSIEDVYELASEYKSKKRFRHELVDEKDYIKNPRDEDGYRSLHLIYKYRGRNSQAKEYDNLRVELQVRTKLQHVWATAVETMGTFLGQALKSRLGDRAWQEFFALVSSAFAITEGQFPIPKHQKMTRAQIFSAIAKADEELQVLEKIKRYTIAVRVINKTGDSSNGWFYHLVILNSETRTIQIKSYKRGAMKRALQDYSKIEQETLRGRKIEAVLVSAGPMKTLKQAYPNFFLDISDFVKKLEAIIKKGRKDNK